MLPIKLSNGDFSKFNYYLKILYMWIVFRITVALTWAFALLPPNRHKVRNDARHADRPGRHRVPRGDARAILSEIRSAAAALALSRRGLALAAPNSVRALFAFISYFSSSLQLHYIPLIESLHYIPLIESFINSSELRKNCIVKSSWADWL